MKSVSSGNFRRGRKKEGVLFKWLLIFLAVCAGMLAAMENRLQTLRIAEVEIEPVFASRLSDTVWREIPRGAERFWPLLWSSKHAYEAAVERAHPVRAELRFKGWGRYRLELEYLAPFFRLYWEKQHWYVSSDGRMWPAALPDNDLIDLSGALGRPVLAWGGERASPFDFANAGGGVHRSSLPVRQIIAWYDHLERLGWSAKVKSLHTGKREGIGVVRLVFSGAGGENGVGILFSDDPRLWREAGLAVTKIYPDITRISQKIFIDTTYQGKIIVSNRVK